MRDSRANENRAGAFLFRSKPGSAGRLCSGQGTQREGMESLGMANRMRLLAAEGIKRRCLWLPQHWYDFIEDSAPHFVLGHEGQLLYYALAVQQHYPVRVGGEAAIAGRYIVSCY